METLIYSIAIVAGLGLALGLALALADKYISVKKDPKEAEILACLSGANCGSCGYAGCAGMAEALACGKAVIDGCPVASAEAREKIAKLIGSAAAASEPKVAAVACGGGARCVDRGKYDGMADCRAAAASGRRGCPYGCIGFMSCARVCPAKAISPNENGVPQINREKCIACGKCAAECPRDLIEMMPLRTKVFLGCSSKEKGRKVREICTAGCIGCGLCAKGCQQNAITMVDAHPVFDNDLCISCGKCKAKCPQHALY